MCLAGLGGRPRLATPHPQGVPKQVGVLPWETTRISISLAGHMVGAGACWTLAGPALLTKQRKLSQALASQQELITCATTVAARAQAEPCHPSEDMS